VKAKDSPEARARSWAERYAADEGGVARRAFYNRMVERHGTKAPFVYRWASGFKESAPQEWRAPPQQAGNPPNGGSP
jgi:hypothetical protein